MLWPVGVVFQTLQMLRVIAPLPAIKGLRADAEVAAGKTGIVTVGIVVIKPLQSLAGFS